MNTTTCRFIQSRRTSLRWMLVCAAGMAGSLMSTSVQARPRVETMKYVNITQHELIQHYTNAYVATGFYLAGEETDPGGYFRRLLFKFKDPHYPGMTEGSLEIAFSGDPSAGHDACAPCEVHYRSLGNFGNDYSPEQQSIALERLLAAAAAARAKLVPVPLAERRDTPSKPESPVRIYRNDRR